MDIASPKGKVVTLDESRTEEMVEEVTATLQSAATAFDGARQLARRLGAHRAGDRCEVMFWAPELQEYRVPDGDIFIEVLDVDDDFSLLTARQTVRFHRTRVPIGRVDAWCMAAIEGMRPGSRDVIGSFYSLVWRDADNNWSRILDPLAASLPFGAFAPAEYYDIEAMQEAREDKEYYRSLPNGDPYKFGPVTNILQVHVPTATASMSIAGFTRHIEMLAERVRQGGPLEPADRVFLGYDAIQLLPVEPTTVYEAGPDFWTEVEEDEAELTVDIRRPDTTNWGYDVVIAGMAAVNPTLLEKDRPDELLDLAVALHNFPGSPKKLILDVVYGHSDNQGLEVLNHHYFAGPNMYGQNINYRNWVVRAILQEMQRRKVNYGADGVRVDGAQDFKWWDSDAQMLRHDDEYLQEMADIVQDVAGRQLNRPEFVGDH